MTELYKPTKAMFDAIRQIKGSALTQDDVDLFNAAVGGVVAGVVAASAKNGMRCSAAGIALIHGFEQLRLTAYPDPGSSNGLPITNGWGTTRDEDGGPIPRGAQWTSSKADRLFARDLATFELGVNALLAGAPTTQGQFDALVSFAYNVGLDIDEDTRAEGLGDSTLLRKHKAGDFAGASREFAKWNKNDGVVLRGLTRRREAERLVYVS
jgi:lysozyme